MLDFIEREFQLKGENIDPKYFSKSDNGYKATPLLKYIIARDAKKFFRKKIEELDDGTYLVIKLDKPTKVIFDNEANEKEKEKYQQEFEKIDKIYDEYKESHLNEFNEIFPIDYGENEESQFTQLYEPNISYTLQEAIIGYNTASEMEKKYGSKSDNYDRIPRKKPYYRVKKEFEEQHRQMKESWYPEVGLPDPKIFKKQIEIPNIIFKWQVGKKLGTDEKLVSDFSMGLIEYITHIKE